MKDQPAFPGIPSETHYTATGLTKLEYFSAMAMQGVLSDSKLMQTIRVNSHDGGEPTEEFVAGLAVEYAKALIAELEKEHA